MRQILILFATAIAHFFVFVPNIQAQDTRVEYGKCGYYAASLHGRKTASGEIYDKNLLTCAHKTLPFGTQIRVTRMDNKKSVVVRVNDRGPYLDGYVTDISGKAAEQIGLFRDGVTRVKIEVVGSQEPRPVTVSTRILPSDLEPVTYSKTIKPVTKSASKTQIVVPKKTAPLAPTTYSTISQPVPATVSPSATTVSELVQIDIRGVERRGFCLQLAVLGSTENLFQEIAKLQNVWPGKVIVNHEEVKETGVASFKLMIGPYASRKEAETQQKKAATKGYKKSFVVDLSQY